MEASLLSMTVKLPLMRRRRAWWLDDILLLAERLRIGCLLHAGLLTARHPASDGARRANHHRRPCHRPDQSARRW
jgi:hypothetical protein